MVCIGLYCCVLVCIGLYWFEFVCISLYKFVLVCIGLYWFVLVCIGLYWFALVCINLYWFVLVVCLLELELSLHGCAELSGRICMLMGTLVDVPRWYGLSQHLYMVIERDTKVNTMHFAIFSNLKC